MGEEAAALPTTPLQLGPEATDEHGCRSPQEIQGCCSMDDGQGILADFENEAIQQKDYDPEPASNDLDHEMKPNTEEPNIDSGNNNFQVCSLTYYEPKLADNESDREMKRNIDEAEDDSGKNNLQLFTDDCVIPKPVDNEIDHETKPNIDEADDDSGKNNLQMFTDDCIIPKPVDDEIDHETKPNTDEADNDSGKNKLQMFTDDCVIPKPADDDHETQPQMFTDDCIIVHETKPNIDEEDDDSGENNLQAFTDDCFVPKPADDEIDHETKPSIDDCVIPKSADDEIDHETEPNIDEADADSCKNNLQTFTDHETKPSIDEAEDDSGKNNLQAFTDDCIIPSPVLKGSGTATFFGSDPISSLQLLGTKYNTLLKKYEEQTSELETFRADMGTLGSKCIQECKPKYEALKQKYTQECSERKRLYNELIELKGNIRVFCRCRPLSAEEISKGYTSVFDFDPSQDTDLQIISSDSSRKHFKFDHVFGPKDNQESVFAETLPIVNSVLDGYNVCIFAYGQTGTGKTFTMEGTPENRGVNYRALEELFKRSSERSSMMKYQFSVSMLEVYNEKIRDLLAGNLDQAAKKLEIKQTADGTQEVPGLIEAQACSNDEVWEMLKTGARNRSVGSTCANELSSRSHCLVRVTIRGENLVNGQRNRSNLWLVDLAGSERVGKSEVEGERLKESQFINKSLSALGDVISALATKNPHIPYRNSKLTHLLQSSLGGDCKTLMFAQISPSSADLGETLCSLNFASRVRGVEHGPARKQSDPAESFKLKQMAEKLKQEEKETARLTESLQLINLKYLSRENVFKTLHEKIRDAEQACKNYQQKVRDLETQLADQRRAGNQETRDLTRSSKPPLPPVKSSRQPLGKITNRLSSLGPRRNSITKMPPLENKENPWDKSTNSSVKARRISLSPVVRAIPVQKKRRSTIAILPGRAETMEPLPEEHQLRHSTIGPSRMRDLRSSVGTFMPAATPDNNKGSFSSISSSSKYSSPPPLQALGKPRLLPSFGSPRKRLRLVSSPGSSSNAQTQNKLCFSLQKRVIVNSPALSRPAGSSLFRQFRRDRETVGQLGGTAQRVLCTNRRKSVM